MDPSPPFFHRSPRYVHLPPPPPPFSGDPTFYLPPPPPPRHHPYNHPLRPPPYDLRRPNLLGYSPPRVRVPLEDHRIGFEPPRARVRNDFLGPDYYRLNFDYRDRDTRNYDYSHVFRESYERCDYGSGSNLNEFSDRRDEEDIYNSPNKQVQKKSALLRIQFNKSKGRKNRNEDTKRLDAKRLDTKGLETKGFRNKGSEREEREGSSMELDVSFKSNSLVAKAIDVERDSKSLLKKRKVTNIANTPSKKSNGGVGLKEKGVKGVSLKSLIVSPPPEEAEMKLNDKNREKSMCGVVSSEEVVFVDVGGTPVGKVNEKINSSSDFSSLIGVNRTSIDSSPVGRDKSDDLSSVRNVDNTSVEVVTIADNNVTYLEEVNAREGHLNLSNKSSDDEHIDLVSDKNRAEITVSDNKSVDFVTETNIPVVVDKNNGEIECNLVTPSTVDVFLREVSEAIPTTSNSLPRDRISREQHIVDSSTEKDSSSSLSVDSSDSDFSSERTNSSNETITKYGKTGKVIASDSSSPIPSEEEDDSDTLNSSVQLPASIDKEWPQLEDRDEDLKFDKSPFGISSPSSDGAVDLTENSLHIEKEIEGNGKEFDAVEEQGLLSTVSLQNWNSVETDIDTYQRSPVTDMECDDYLIGKDNMPSVPTDMSLCTNDESNPLKVSNSGSQETLPVGVESQMLKTKTEFGQISEEMDWEVLLNQEEKPSVEGPSTAYPLIILQNTSNKENSADAVGTVNAAKPRVVSLMRVGVKTSKSPLPPAVPRSFRLNSSVSKTPQSSQNLRPSTWQRSSSPSPPIPVKPTYPSSVYHRAPSPTLTGNLPKVAYVRQGNSLVRKTPPTSVTSKAHVLSSSSSWLNPSTLDETKKLAGNYSNVNFNSSQIPSRTELDATIERPNTPPLPSSTKVSNRINPSSDTELETLNFGQNMDLSKASNGISEISASRENIPGQIDSMESNAMVQENLVPTDMGKVVYVKRKVNQLVAAKQSQDLSSAGYFKRRENQLVRKPLDNLQKLDLISQENRVSQVIASSFQKRSGRGFRKICKPSRFSLVWTLRKAESMKKDTSLLSYLFPWKRATHRRRFTYNQTSVSSNCTSSSISRKLLFSRQQKSIYKRSFHGLSLRISNVSNFDGRGLKWSKSMDKNCKKANERATLAVAAVEREKRGKDVITSRTKSRNHMSRERIVRVGSVRYKMDPTRRTLQRISDEESPCSFAVQSGKIEKQNSVPRRLVIGNREYVRIGNGNQLIRDPKKRTRILASEKVRWSLHTARLLLARKKTYCQFFTRFGKCDKGGGKCPYIHDPEKIAVCTKFLLGLCSDSNCKLTHKVIPERMQDCSFFLQGLCSNVTCPYRHVNVNPNASICGGFLRGYCADGNECRKKHSYVCPIFESTGTCPQSSNCKLHHPKKNQIKGKKREHCKGKNNFRGRYFGLEHIGVSDTKISVSNKTSSEDDDDIFFQEGKFADFIPLDVSDDEEEGGEPFELTLGQKSCSTDSQPIDIDIDDLIKPVGLMKTKVTMDVSPTV